MEIKQNYFNTSIAAKYIVMDPSNGYEKISAEYLAHRGSTRSTGMGVKEVRAWARNLPTGATVLDAGCGSGLPLTEILVAEGLNAFGVDASPSFVEAFKRNLPGVPVLCEAVQNSQFFNRSFDAVLAWGLIFPLSAQDQRHLVRRFADVLAPGGRLLFTSPAQACTWKDAMTGLESRSLGADEYRRLLLKTGFSIRSEYEDEGQNHYYDVEMTDSSVLK